MDQNKNTQASTVGYMACVFLATEVQISDLDQMDLRVQMVSGIWQLSFVLGPPRDHGFYQARENVCQVWYDA